MKRVLLTRLALALPIPLALVVGFIGQTSDAAASVKANAKSKRLPSTVLRAQSNDSRSVQTTSLLSDEEIFDRELSHANAQSPNSCTPNCTTVPNSGIPDPYSGFPGDNGLASPRPLPDPGSPLSDPASVFSQPQQSQLPAPVSSLAAGQGASSAMGYVPAMMGDGFSGNSTVFTNYESAESGNTKQFSIAAPGFGGGVGTVKLMETGSPIPRDRIMMNYSYFSGVPLNLGNTNINRFTPGFEKTFFGGNTSIEVRVPMAITQGSFDHDTSAVSSNNAFQFGNLTGFAKALVYRDKQFALSVGTGLTLPTASDAVLQSSDFSGIQKHTDILIKNQSPHLMPFIGGTYTPDERWFTQSIIQVDVATRGNKVYAEGTEESTLHNIGTLTDSAFLYASIGTGYWIHRAPYGTSRLTGLAPIAELHFNQSLQGADSVTIPNNPAAFPNSFGNTIGGGLSNVSVTNAVVGVTMLFDEDKSMTLGYTTPLGGGSDKQFNGEFRLLFNWYFGAPTNRLTRVQF